MNKTKKGKRAWPKKLPKEVTNSWCMGGLMDGLVETKDDLKDFSAQSKQKTISLTKCHSKYCYSSFSEFEHQLCGILHGGS